jgi:hypothetical protein
MLSQIGMRLHFGILKPWHLEVSVDVPIYLLPVELFLARVGESFQILILKI